MSINYSIVYNISRGRMRVEKPQNAKKSAIFNT